MNRFSIAIAALAALSTASFAEGDNHGSDGYGGAKYDRNAAVDSKAQAVYPTEEESSEDMNSFYRTGLSKSDGGRDGHGGHL